MDHMERNVAFHRNGGGVGGGGSCVQGRGRTGEFIPMKTSSNKKEVCTYTNMLYEPEL